jgi:hypothetical protein
MGVTITSKTEYTSFYTYLQEHLEYPYGVNKWGDIYKKEPYKLLFFNLMAEPEIGHVHNNQIMLYGSNSILLSVVIKIAEEYSKKTGNNIEIITRNFVDL